MQLHFLKQDVQKLLEHTKDSKSHVPIYGDESTRQPGLLLVANEGIYLVSNGIPGLFKDNALALTTLDNPAFVAYATECNPNTQHEEEWRRVKNEAFDSDDVKFLETYFIEAALLRPGKYIQLEVNEEGIKALY
ncbi:hypothetical protein RIVM261_057120 [Rivularia sp. IAM M-261]|nr:hypothetical protein CAL7716_032120 [Calothrix sp. PCC 7716]GJD20756.1 hypothetical protein RIVM261_057120 [Rivularia sp. IAM M-261]